MRKIMFVALLMLPLLMFAQQKSARVDKPDTKASVLDAYVGKLPTGSVVIDKDEATGRIFFLKVEPNMYDSTTKTLCVYDSKKGVTETVPEEPDWETVEHYVVCPDGKSLLLFINHGGAHQWSGLVKVNKTTYEVTDYDFWTYKQPTFLQNEFIYFNSVCLNPNAPEYKKRYKYRKIHYNYNGVKLRTEKVLVN